MRYRLSERVLRALCVGVPILALLASIPGLVGAYLVKRDGVNTLGTITDASCGNHRTYAFAFDVNGKTYSGFGGRPCETVRLGDAVSVWYLPSDPRTNTGSDPSAQFRGISSRRSSW